MQPPRAARDRSAPVALISRPRLRVEILVKLVLFVAERIRIGRRGFLRCNIWPLVTILAIELQPLLQTALGVRFYCVHRSFRLADAAIDALVRVNDEHVGALVKTIDRTNLHAVGEFAFNASVQDDVGHGSLRSRGRLDQNNRAQLLA